MANYDIEKLKKAADIVGKIGTGIVGMAALAGIVKISNKGENSREDITNKNNVKVVAYNKDGKAYMRVGPFNWTFGGKVTDVNVYDQNGKSISEKLYSSYYGNEERFYGVGNIKSGSDFYISVPLNENTTKITKISGNLQREVKAVNIWFLESNYAAYQNLIVREPYTTTENIPFTFD